MRVCQKIIHLFSFLQVSSHRRNINLKFLDILQEKREDSEMKELMSVGTYSLHIVHCGFQHGEIASQWNLKKIFDAMLKIFLKSPSRRADYEKITGAESNDYPQFCAYFWVEIDIVTKQAQKAWPKVMEVVEYWQSLSNRNSQDREIQRIPLKFH